MLNKTDLIFLSGWRRKATDTFLKTVSINNATTLIDHRFTGIMDSFYFYSSDNQVEVSIIIDQAEKRATVQDIYLAGYLYPNASMPYVGTYLPTNGTAGYYIILWNPTEVEPVNEHISVTARLLPSSTQTSALVRAQVLYYDIADRQAFLSSLHEYMKNFSQNITITIPQEQSTSVPSQYKKNPLLYVP